MVPWQGTEGHVIGKKPTLVESSKPLWGGENEETVSQQRKKRKSVVRLKLRLPSLNAETKIAYRGGSSVSGKKKVLEKFLVPGARGWGKTRNDTKNNAQIGRGKRRGQSRERNIQLS